MTIEISGPAVSAFCVVAALLSKGIHGLFSTALEKRDVAITNLYAELSKQNADHNIEVAGVKSTQKTLFEKLDAVTDALHKYKLHVAETYVIQSALEKILYPIERRLQAIENDLRGERSRS
jgi:hypothetical protein